MAPVRLTKEVKQENLSLVQKNLSACYVHSFVFISGDTCESASALFRGLSDLDSMGLSIFNNNLLSSQAFVELGDPKVLKGTLNT